MDIKNINQIEDTINKIKDLKNSLKKAESFDESKSLIIGGAYNSFKVENKLKEEICKLVVKELKEQLESAEGKLKLL